MIKHKFDQAGVNTDSGKLILDNQSVNNYDAKLVFCVDGGEAT